FLKQLARQGQPLIFRELIRNHIFGSKIRNSSDRHRLNGRRTLFAVFPDSPKKEGQHEQNNSRQNQNEPELTLPGRTTFLNRRSWTNPVTADPILEAFINGNNPTEKSGHIFDSLVYKFPDDPLLCIFSPRDAWQSPLVLGFRDHLADGFI